MFGAVIMSTLCEANRWPYAIRIVRMMGTWTDTETS
jgi:hypothetical protein